MARERWFRFGIAIIMIFLIIWLGTKISFIFTPIVVIINTLFAPIVLAGVLYYLLRPTVDLLSRRLPRLAAIIVVFASIAALILSVLLFLGPALQRQISLFMSSIPELKENFDNMLYSIEQKEWYKRLEAGGFITIDRIADYLVRYIKQVQMNFGARVSSFISFITNIVIVLITIPFVLFFMLKDGKNAPHFIMNILPKKHHKEANDILDDMDDALSAYIQGQLIVSVCVGVMATIGYLLIGLDYPLVLGLIAMLTNVIPFIGPWIGTFPAVVVGLFSSPWQALLVIIVVIVIQQIDSNFISPFVMGRKLSIHPLTIIFILLAAGQIAGIIGLLLAVPFYAVAKVIISHMYSYIKLE